MTSWLMKVLPVMLPLLLLSTTAAAAGEEAAAGGAGGMIALGAGLAIGLAGLGGGLGQGNATASALQGVARNPQTAGTIQTQMIIGLAFIESLVIYSLVIAFMLQGKI